MWYSAGRVSCLGDYLIALRKPDMDFISQSEVEALDESYAENVGLTVGELMNKSHDSAWTKARAKGNDEVMPSIARFELDMFGVTLIASINCWQIDYFLIVQIFDSFGTPLASE